MEDVRRNVRQQFLLPQCQTCAHVDDETVGEVVASNTRRNGKVRSFVANPIGAGRTEVLPALVVEAEEVQAMESDGEEMIDESVAIRSSSSTGSVDSDSEEVINFGIQPLVRTLEYFQELRGQHLSIPCHTWGVAAPDVFKCSVEEVRTRNAAASVARVVRGAVGSYPTFPVKVPELGQTYINQPLSYVQAHAIGLDDKFSVVECPPVQA